MTAASWLVALLGAAGLLLAGNHYAWGWALFAGAQVLSLPPPWPASRTRWHRYWLAAGLVALHHWRRDRRPLVRVRWPGRSRRGVARARW